ncbi:hypothetical protein TRFO_37922 [Tritrichomonas foetus]|uniref:Uncharacterized protein n=1 Tax=Tritrichomonas foetus TaxID=1144522 RepID=A0A1J4JCG4_9EUKA|nr:hypothetical protein TRFO_37922 [Tritrichomonas foetus]|eukprot:OHS95951.1 hypothetical protein TRFO_37922 [Tritrichomonas foetus]
MELKSFSQEEVLSLTDLYENPNTKEIRKIPQNNIYQYVESQQSLLQSNISKLKNINQICQQNIHIWHKEFDFKLDCDDPKLLKISQISSKCSDKKPFLDENNILLQSECDISFQNEILINRISTESKIIDFSINNTEKSQENIKENIHTQKNEADEREKVDLDEIQNLILQIQRY